MAALQASTRRAWTGAIARAAAPSASASASTSSFRAASTSAAATRISVAKQAQLSSSPSSNPLLLRRRIASQDALLPARSHLQAQLRAVSVSGVRHLSSTSAAASSSSSSSKTHFSKDKGKEQDDDDDAEEGPPKNASWSERFRFMRRRYGLWALVVYLLASAVDFSLVFALIHFAGADHIKEWERKARAYVGLGAASDAGEKAEEVKGAVGGAIQAVKEKVSSVDLGANNQDAARRAVQLRDSGASLPPSTTSTSPASSSPQSSGWLSGSLGTKIVLAYTIHKTALLPFRIALTAAVLPSFVKLMVRLGWSRPNAAIQMAAKAATQRAAARK